MIRDENIVGIQLEVMLVILFAIYIVTLIIRAGREKKLLERENREMGYIIKGITTLFARFAMVDLEAGTYQYLAGTRAEDSSLDTFGPYENLTQYLCSIIIDEEDRKEFGDMIDRETLVQVLTEQSDMRFERHVLRGGQPEWEHMNVICLERKDGKAVKALIIRQNITEIKEKELEIQEQMFLASRKERQYQLAIMSNSIYTFEFNLSKDLIEQDILRTVDGQQMSMLELTGLSAPCRASEWFERRRKCVAQESVEDYKSIVNIDHLKECFEAGEAEVSVEYWGKDLDDQEICVRQSFLMTQDDRTGDIVVMVVKRRLRRASRSSASRRRHCRMP